MVDGTREALARLLSRGTETADRAAVERQERAMRQCGARVITMKDDDYPPRLRVVPSAPELLFARGDVALAHGPAVAIVGTRKPSAAGAALATRLARSLAMLDLTVVSGMARGIDTAAHRGALDVGGRTVAVLGTGVDVVYPPENGDLMECLARHGCLLSEQACGTEAFAHVFPRRNRIISGLCEAVIVVEGGVRSGALITARWALEQGREVGAVPGFPGDFRSAGPNQLLRDGAFLVEGVDDVIASVTSLAAHAGPRLPADAPADGIDTPGLDADAARVLDLVANAATADDVARLAAIGIERAQEILARLEIDGRVVRDAMDRFTRPGR